MFCFPRAVAPKPASFAAIFAAAAGLCACGGTGTPATPVTPPQAQVRAALVESSDAGGALPDETAAATTDLIDNGGFEVPTVATGNLTRYSAGAKIGAWKVVGAGNVDVLSETFEYGGYTFKPQRGKQHVDLTGNSQSVTGVEQTVATTAGHTYTLTFWVGNVVDSASGLGVSSTVNVLVDGKQFYKAINSKMATTSVPSWQRFIRKITATSTATTIAFMNGDPSNDTYNGLDTISLTP
jgi:hypothetical protein